MTSNDDRRGLLDEVKQFDALIFGIGLALSLVVIAAIAIDIQAFSTALASVNGWLVTNMAWYYVGSAFFITVFFLWVMLGPWGRIKLGDPDEDPEHGYFSYFAMMFSAAMAAGLVFFGAAEPLFHYASSPPVMSSEPQTTAAITDAITYALFHFGITPWATYLTLAVPLAYYVHRKDAPMRPSTVLIPLVGRDALDSPWLKSIDGLVLFISAGGAASSLGFIALQLSVSFSYNLGIQPGLGGQFAILAVVTGAFILSAVAGIEKGIKRVSTLNMVLFAAILISVFALGRSAALLNLGSQALGGYVDDFFTMSLYAGVGGSEWLGSWTVFYWAAWFVFAPLIGVFMARISRGRTVRELIFTALFGSFAVTLPWFTVIGGSAVFVQNSGGGLLATVSEYGAEVAAYALIDTLPMGNDVLAILFTLLVTTFLVTTLDSSTYIMAIFASDGDTTPGKASRVIWGIITAVISGLLLAIGGLNAIQQFFIALGLPVITLSLVATAALVLEWESLNSVMRGTDRSVPAVENARGVNRPNVPAEDD
jgi:glycine betaine transporter